MVGKYPAVPFKVGDEMKDFIKNMILKFRLWFKRDKKCPHCCVICRFFNDCIEEMRNANEFS